ncbi:MAG TPA: tetratricopeptide repeat protein [Spirochaetia bacterium]|nr:tetratricopeptide repeat protein [Spirochaetia bacterium]
MPTETPLAGKEIALTGRLFSMTREEAIERIRNAGGLYVRSPGQTTAFLVAGSALGHLTPEGILPRRMGQFRELKSRGASIRLMDEPELLRLLGADEDLEDFSRLYTGEQVSRIVEVPATEVRAWVRRGLLRPARLTHRLAWFGFEDILTARNLSRLTASGVPASLIHQSLSQIAQWLPDGERILERLEAYATGLRLRLPDGSWVEPSGQRLMDFQIGGHAAAVSPPTARITQFPSDGGVERHPAEETGDWFSLAVEAEESGNLEAAANRYTRALETATGPEISFNLGNVLYELGREADAAERYLQALDADRNFAEAWNNLGNSLVALGRLGDGVQAYEMALSLEPEYPEPHCNLTAVLDRMGQFEKAHAHRAICQRAFPSPVRLRILRQSSLEGSES